MSISISRSLMDRVRRQPPFWAANALKGCELSALPGLVSFASRIHRCDRASVDLTRVAGSTETEHVGRTWVGLLTTGGKMAENLVLHARNPAYYLGTDPKPLFFVSPDGFDWFICAGHHRTCIARFDLHYRRLTHLHGVRTEQYILDRELYDLYAELARVRTDRALSCLLEPRRELLRREEGPGWSLERYRPAIRYRAAPGQPVGLLEAGAARRVLEQLKSSRYRRWFALLPGLDRVSRRVTGPAGRIGLNRRSS